MIVFGYFDRCGIVQANGGEEREREERERERERERMVVAWVRLFSFVKI